MFANDNPVSGVRFSLKLKGGEPLFGNDEPGPSCGVGVLTCLTDHASRT